MAIGPGRPISPRPEFDLEKFERMQEPFSVRVERIKDSRRSNVPLWESQSGQSNGQGFTKDEVRTLEQNLLEWAGGGYYRIAITDSTPETPITMKWEPFYATATYPEKIPPPLADAASPDAPAGTSQPPPPQGPRMPPFTPFQGSYPTPGYGSMPPPPAFGSPHWPNYQAELERRERDAENRRLREEADRREREAREAVHRTELERERAANNDRFSRLESAIGSLADSIKGMAAVPKGPSPELLEMQRRLDEQAAALRKADERAENARREQEADRREALLRDQIRQQSEEAKRAYEATQRQIETMNQQFQTMIANLTNQLATNANRQDPLLTLIAQVQQQHAETIKAMASESRQALEKVQAFVMNPRELMALARESAEGADKAVERTTRLTNEVITMQNRVLETALATAPGGTSVVDVVAQGINGVKETLEKFVGGKAREGIAQAHAQAEIARAQAHVLEIQARAANPAAFAGATPLPAASGLEGVSTPPAAPPPADAAVAPAIKGDPERLWGRTDLDWFGQTALVEVLQLRAGVAKFLAAAKQALETGQMPESVDQLPGTKPAEVAMGIMIAAQQAQAQGLIIPAMVDLLMPGELDSFVKVLLPDAPVDYRNEVVALLRNPPQDADEEEEEEDNSDEDPEERAPQPAIEPKGRRTKNGTRARA